MDAVNFFYQEIYNLSKRISELEKEIKNLKDKNSK